ncbi:MAG TPA: phosphate ABC transporter substrate-binding protein PstS [Nitrosopumilaceae archaeon]|nr:phosphate ABC transporter substrate-binding protein PstS [Nitrosopumilaceae archaeon]
MRTITSLILIVVLLTSVVSPLYVQAQTSKEYSITGAGATFPFPLIDLWRVKYNEKHPNISLNYQSIGSGGGVKQHIENTVNFGATDAPLTANEVQLAPDSLHIPEAIGGITVTYNIPEVPKSGLKLTGTQVADIFLGKITKWNDPSIKANNPTLNLPNKEIVTAHRSDGSGTTYGFTEYLSIISPEWEEKVGFGKSVPWPVGLGAAGNEGVAGIVKSTPYSVGYVELAYVMQNNMAYAFVQNADKTAFVEPTLKTMSAAAAGAATKLPQAHESWAGVSINNSPGKESYPITSFTYLLVHEKLEKAVKDKAQAKEVINLIKWMITDGQKHSPELLYVSIPVEVTEIGLKGLARITYNGEKLYDGPTTYSGDGLLSTTEKQTKKIPDWIRNIFKFYGAGQIGDDDLINVIQFLIKEGIIKLQ